MANIRIEHLAKTYPGNVEVIEDFSLNISDGEFMIFVGPSGSGKSTMLRMIAGLEEITAGSLYINDKLVNDLEPKARNIAMVFQNYALYPHMTVYRNMAFSLELAKMPKAEIDEKVREAAKILDIDHLLNRKPSALSGGQRQRVALGRAMVRDPEVFLLDEPLSNLDAKLRTTMRSEISKLHKQLGKTGTTFIYVTHDQVEAMTMADRIAVMDFGELQQVDTPTVLYNTPANKFVAGFIGSPPMNFFQGTLLKEGEQFYVQVGALKVLVPAGVASREGLEERLSQSVHLGIRPENLHIEEVVKSAPYATVMDVTVERGEMLGSETFLYSHYGDAPVIAKLPPRNVLKEGDALSLALDGKHLHLFDWETENRIL